MLQFSVVEFLKEQGIKYYTAGTKNTSKGWVSIRCPFCNDHSNHLGINLQDGNYTCWLCHKSGSFQRFIAYILKVPLEKANLISKQFTTTEGNRTKIHNDRRCFKQEADWILVKTGREHPALSSFLKRRKFSLDIIKRERCWVTSHGEYKHRLIIPIYSKGNAVGVQGRAMTKNAALPYLNSPDIYDYIYWIDDWAGGEMVVCEGAFDSWRIGKGLSVSLFSTSFSKEQIRMIKEVNPRRVLIAFDQDARKKAVKLKIELEPFMPVRILNIVSDPAEMETKTLLELIRGGKNGRTSTQAADKGSKEILNAFRT